MQMCYVDESGDTGIFAATERNSQPVFLLCALLLGQAELEGVTQDVIALKRRWFPSPGKNAAHWHDWLGIEIKGANLRRALREDTHRSRRHVLGFLDAALRVLERRGARLAARVYVKEPGGDFNGTHVYSAGMQKLAETYEDWLVRKGEPGIMVLDSRNKAKNVPVAQSLFTWMFRAQGPGYRRMAELPLFGHSDSHAMLQLADWVGSALLSPMAARAYCAEHGGTCVHASPCFDPLRERFGQRLKALQYRYESAGKKRGGIHVLGGRLRLNPLLLFGEARARPAGRASDE